MGRKTYLSIGKPLPGRETIVLTRDAHFSTEGVHVAHSLDGALELAPELGRAMGAHSVIIGGGTEIYGQAHAFRGPARTDLRACGAAGRCGFPGMESRCLRSRRARKDHPHGPDDEHAFTFATFRRRDEPASVDDE